MKLKCSSTGSPVSNFRFLNFHRGQIKFPDTYSISLKFNHINYMIKKSRLYKGDPVLGGKKAPYLRLKFMETLALIASKLRASEQGGRRKK